MKNLKEHTKKTLGFLLIAVIVLSVVSIELPVKATELSGITVTNVGGWNEILYIQLSGVTDSQVTKVSYSGPVSGTLTGDDFTYLVRDCDGKLRIDIPGLKPGTYSITVQTSNGTITRTGIAVTAQDRSGYAHFNYTQGVGAYNDDGTLKDNAIVIYVTNDNKNTVTVTSKDGTTVKGIGHILNSSGRDVGRGLNGNGGLANNNSNIIEKLSNDGTPLVVRIIGNVTAPNGLTAFDSVDYGGTVGGNGYMARIKSGKDITIEGIGYDATINGWGLHFMANSSTPQYGRNFEVRNISFRNVPEDCIGMEGVRSNSTVTMVERCWIHNCAFYGPTIANPADWATAGGDGACDFKRGQYYTNSYCYYDDYDKANLVGASEADLQYHVTFHHNYWKDCVSRAPLSRNANIHMYNNVFTGASGYVMNTRADAYIFSEYNIFEKCANPGKVESGAIKSYKDTFTNCTYFAYGGSLDAPATVVTSKTAQVSTNCKYANFDTNASVSYIPSGNYLLHTNNSTLKSTVIVAAGTMSSTLNGGSSGGSSSGSSSSGGSSSGGSSSGDSSGTSTGSGSSSSSGGNLSGSTTGGSENTTQGGQTGGSENTTQGGQAGGSENTTQGGQTGGSENTTQGGQAGGNENTTQGGQAGGNENTTQGGTTDGNESTTHGGSVGENSNATEATQNASQNTTGATTNNNGEAATTGSNSITEKESVSGDEGAIKDSDNPFVLVVIVVSIVAVAAGAILVFLRVKK